MKILSLNIERLTHGIKTAFACLIGYAITKSIHLPVDQWLIITILVVMCAQINVGSIIQKSYVRFLGTLTGSLIGGLTLFFFGTEAFATAIAITLSALLFSYIATGQTNYNEAGTLGVVTVVIILIGQNPTVISAIGRFLEISAGIVIAGLVSQFVLPIHARKIIIRNQAFTLRQLSAYCDSMFLSSKKQDFLIEKQVSLEEAIVKSFITQRKLSAEAAREPFGIPFNVKQFNHTLWCEREILRSITFMSHAYHSSHSIKKFFSEYKILPDFQQSISEALEKIANCIEKNNYDVLIVLPNIKPFKEKILKASRTLSENDVINVHAFLFCSEILIKRMEDLLKKRQRNN